MITEKQLQLFGVFAQTPFAEHTRKEIKQKAKEKSNNALALTIQALKKEQVLIERKIGRSGILTLNLDNTGTMSYLALCNQQKLHHLVQLALPILRAEISKDTPFYAIAIFGSHAIGEQKKDSDVDIAIFIDDDDKKKQVEASARSSALKIPLDMDIYVISRQEMIVMLTNDEENLGKQIARKHLAVHNQQIFYAIVKEGMHSGFRA